MHRLLFAITLLAALFAPAQRPKHLCQPCKSGHIFRGRPLVLAAVRLAYGAQHFLTHHFVFNRFAR